MKINGKYIDLMLFSSDRAVEDIDGTIGKGLVAVVTELSGVLIAIQDLRLNEDLSRIADALEEISEKMNH